MPSGRGRFRSYADLVPDTGALVTELAFNHTYRPGFSPFAGPDDRLAKNNRLWTVNRPYSCDRHHAGNWKIGDMIAVTIAPRQESTMTYRRLRIVNFVVVGALLLGGACSDSASDAPLDGGPPLSTVGLDVARPAGPPTLDTGVDPARLAADIAPVVADFIRGTTTEMMTPIGFTSPADADAMQVGRPYGIFTIHKGPWLEFMGYWRAAVLIGGEYRSIVGVKLEGDKYVMVSIGSAQFAPMLAEREKLPAVSAALDAGRAGLLQLFGDGGISLLAYEAALPDGATEPDIRVQSFAWYPSVIPGIDGSAPPPESTLAEIDKTLPAE